MKEFLYKYRHAWTLLYVFIYIPWFNWLEANVKTYTTIHVRLDEMIPFCEYFIIPYLLWFAYVGIVMMFVFFTSREEFYKCAAYLFIGMTICLFICTVWPNGQDLRITITNDNLCSRLVGMIYKSDTNTNVFPSIHVFNSVGMYIFVCKSRILKEKKGIRVASFVLSVLIIMSTVILKQHSVVDAVGGLILGIIMYIFVYGVDYSKVFSSVRQKNAKSSLEGENV